MTATEDVVDERAAAGDRGPDGLRLALYAIIAVAALVIAGGAGWLLRGDGGSGSSSPSANSVDAGFARDMATHHTQAVLMAAYERDNTSDKNLKLLAYDIESTQNQQIGEMQGWLDDWGLSRNSENPMSWMPGHHMIGPGGLMPGMATPTQIDRLESLHGKALDILFLQLMIHHHQGGIDMATYARAHASKSFVRDLAQSMINAQQGEILQMEKTLLSLGAKPLPPPS